MEKYERAGVLAKPGGDLQLALTFGDGDNLPAVTAAFRVSLRNALVAGAGDLEINGVDRAGIVESVILLIPKAGAAFYDLDTCPRLGRLPPHGWSVAGAFIAILRR